MCHDKNIQYKKWHALKIHQLLIANYHGDFEEGNLIVPADRLPVQHLFHLSVVKCEGKIISSDKKLDEVKLGQYFLVNYVKLSALMAMPLRLKVVF